MATITIPQKLIKNDDLIIIPRKEYEGLLHKQRVIPIAKLTSFEKKALDKARREMARGEYITLEKLEYEMGITHCKKC